MAGSWRTAGLEIRLLDDGRDHVRGYPARVGLRSSVLIVNADSARAMIVFATAPTGSIRSSRRPERGRAISRSANNAPERSQSAAAHEHLHGAGCAGNRSGPYAGGGAPDSSRGGSSKQAIFLARLRQSRAHLIHLRFVALRHASSSADRMRSTMTRSSCHSRRTSANIGERARVRRDR